MPYKRKPPVGLSFLPEVYNVLMSVLDDFIDNELDERAHYLKNKIEHYSRIFLTKNNNASVSIYFFENEAADLIILLLFQLYAFTPQDNSHFENLQEEIFKKHEKKSTEKHNAISET